MLTTFEGARRVAEILAGLHEELQADFTTWPADGLSAVIEAARVCGCDDMDSGAQDG